jgi:hypothetical protein
MVEFFDISALSEIDSLEASLSISRSHRAVGSNRATFWRARPLGSYSGGMSGGAVPLGGGGVVRERT